MSNSKRAGEKRSRILDAARLLILRDGIRHTTMEAIAREAGMAKPTLYAHFPDKGAVFAALLEAFLEEILAAADTGFDLEGDLPDRIGEALARQYLAIRQALGESPHAAELAHEPKRSGFQFEDRHLRLEARIVEELRAAGIGAASELASLVTAAAYGVSLKIGDPQQMAGGIRTLCRRLILPELS